MTSDQNELYRNAVSIANAFVFRGKNDEHRSMEELQGRVENVCGYKPDELIQNSSKSWKDLIVDDDRVAVTSALEEAIEKHERWNVPYRINHSQIGEVWVREYGKAEYGPKGEVLHVDGVIVDAASEHELRKSMEKVIAEANLTSEKILSMAENIIKSVQTLAMLAVNAQIEAARSGEAGRGFAIVASEMSRLASENATWANEITKIMRSDNLDRESEPDQIAQDQINSPRSKGNVIDYQPSALN